MALVHREIDGVQAHVLAAAAGRSDRGWLQKARGWDDAAWDDAAARLADRGWLAGDRLALRPWRALGDRGCDRLAELLHPVRRAVVAAGEWPAGNPIGVPDPG